MDRRRFVAAAVTAAVAGVAGCSAPDEGEGDDSDGGDAYGDVDDAVRRRLRVA